MDIGPKTPREQLIAEAAHAQGYQEGIAASLAMIQKRGVNYAQGFEDGSQSVTTGILKRVLQTLASCSIPVQTQNTGGE